MLTTLPNLSEHLYFNITRAKRALRVANSASTICPWVYAADLLTNYSKARAL